MYPVIAHFGPLTIYSYGVMVAIGIVTAAMAACRHARRRGLDADAVADLIFWSVCAGIVGARLTYVMLNWEWYVHDPLSVLRLYEGGLVFQGGLVAGLAAALAYARRRSLPIRRVVDILAIYVPLAHALGRVGCFFNGCCYGVATDSILGVTFSGLNYAAHPVQLYEALALVGIAGILWFRERYPHPQGAMVGLYLMLYGVVRFFLEFLRGDVALQIGGLRIFQYISMLFVIAGAAVWYILKHNEKETHG